MIVILDITCESPSLLHGLIMRVARETVLLSNVFAMIFCKVLCKSSPSIVVIQFNLKSL